MLTERVEPHAERQDSQPLESAKPKLRKHDQRADKLTLELPQDIPVTQAEAAQQPNSALERPRNPHSS
jgi:hypothetical protein